MYNSHFTATDVAKVWKALMIVLSLTMVYVMTPKFTQSAFASVPTQVVLPSNQENANANQSSTEQSSPKKARFLDIVDTNESIRYNKNDYFCLAKNIFHEAGSEPTVGKYAVAQVTLNRMADRRYPDTVCSVVFQHRQFSWANNHSKRWTTPTGPGWEESKRIAREVLEQGKRVKGLDDALFYHATYVRPSWARTKDRVTRIGLHIFYDA